MARARAVVAQAEALAPTGPPRKTAQVPVVVAALVRVRTPAAVGDDAVPTVAVVLAGMQVPDTLTVPVMPAVQATFETDDVVVVVVPKTLVMAVLLPSLGKEPAGTAVHTLMPAFGA